MNKFVASMSNLELETLQNVIYTERGKRQKQARAKYGDERPELDKGEKDLVDSGQFIAAIKSYRNRTGFDLKDSKDKVDEYRNTLNSYKFSEQ